MDGEIVDVEGYPEIAGNFRDTAEGETGHAHGHLDYLRGGGPATGLAIGATDDIRKQPLPVRPMSTPICTQDSRRPLEKKASTRLPIGLRLSRRPKRATQVDSRLF